MNDQRKSPLTGQGIPQGYVPELAGCDPNRDLNHFLRLASAQIQCRLQALEAKHTYAGSGEPQKQMRLLRTLSELIKEQIPSHGNANRLQDAVADQNLGASARETR